jgi:SAM-dependent methyltransferase
VVDKLRRGAKVADVGCGHGASTVLMAQAFPRSTFVGSDFHAESVATARDRASSAAVENRTRFEVAAAGDTVEQNLNAVGRAYYGFSTLLCTPAPLSQPPGAALGTQAGPARIRALTADAGFTRFRQVAQTPFNHVYEVRP